MSALDQGFLAKFDTPQTFAPSEMVEIPHTQTRPNQSWYRHASWPEGQYKRFRHAHTMSSNSNDFHFYNHQPAKIIKKKIDAWRGVATGFEVYDAKDEQGRIWELIADFEYENVAGPNADPKFKMTTLLELEGRCVDGDYHAIVPSPKIMQALKDEIEENEDLAEAESQAVADGRDRKD